MRRTGTWTTIAKEVRCGASKVGQVGFDDVVSGRSERRSDDGSRFGVNHGEMAMNWVRVRS